ncbi:MAG: peptide deformylase [Planctomycetes bacterium]|nr:peptide deformylase [Planctomycetota bacterium]
MRILKWPNPALTAVASPIESVDDSVRATAEEMLMAMAESRGLGLAGPQVGYGKRLICVNVTPGSPEGERVYVNPEIVGREGEVTAEEGCLSLPGVNGKVTRAAKVTVRATDLKGEPLTLFAEGLLSRVLQHEIDHLDGVLITQRFSAIDKAANARSLRELEKTSRTPTASRR